MATQAAYSEKLPQRLHNFFRGLLGHVVPAIDPVATQVRRPRTPHAEHVAIEILKIVLKRPEAEHRALRAPGAAVRLARR